MHNVSLYHFLLRRSRVRLIQLHKVSNYSQSSVALRTAHHHNHNHNHHHSHPPHPPAIPNVPKTKLKAKTSEQPLIIKTKVEKEPEDCKFSAIISKGPDFEVPKVSPEDDNDDDDDDEEERRKKDILAKEAHKKAIFATQVGAGVNGALALLKGAMGVAVSSTALIADAANSLGDLLSDAVVYFTVNEARKRATPDRPWGRGKIEPLGALSVGGLLLVTGVGIGYSAGMVAWDTLNAGAAAVHATVPAVNDEQVQSLTGNDLNHYAALAVSGLSIISKEFLFRKAGQRANSSAVIANAWQHRADVSTSSAVFIGLIGAMLGFPILDPIAGIMVAGLITHQSYKIVGDALKDLSDAPAGEKETNALRDTCLEVKGVLGVKELRARKSGPFLFVEVTVNVDGSISASAAHRLAELTRLELLRDHVGRVANAVVHVNPLGSAGLGEQYPSWARDHDDIVKEIKKAVRPISEIHSVSEVQVYYRDNGTIAAKVDIVLAANLTIQQAHEIATKARRHIEKRLPGIGDIDVDLELEEA
eukprot:scaffold6586_cov169-Ochromonas_danica.AAC.4